MFTPTSHPVLTRLTVGAGQDKELTSLEAGHQPLDRVLDQRANVSRLIPFGKHRTIDSLRPIGSHKKQLDFLGRSQLGKI